MTVSSAIASATFNWTGAETTFTPGFQAADLGDVSVSWVNPAGAVGTLTLNTNFTVSLDGANYVTVSVIAFPPAPAKIAIARNSSPLQIDGFQDGVPWYADVVEGALDLLTFRDQELQRDVRAAFDEIDAEAMRAKAAEAAVASGLASEAARAKGAEATLAGNIGVLVNNIATLASPSIASALGISNLALLPTTLPATPGTFWNNSGALCVTPGGSNPLPTLQPSASGLYWSNGGAVCVS